MKRKVFTTKSVKFLAIAGVASVTFSTAALAQDTANEDCDAVAATETTDDDCGLILPPDTLAATNLAVVAPAAGGVLLLLGLAAGGGTSGTSDTQ